MATDIQKLDTDSVHFMLTTMGSLNSIAQNSYPRLTNNFTRTPLEDAQEAVKSILKFRAFAFSQIYHVKIGQTDHNVIFEKNPKSLFTENEYQILLQDCESTPVDADDFLAFVDKDEETILRDAAFVRNLAPNFGMFFANSDYENKSVLERKQSTASNTTDSISAGVEAHVGYSFFGLFGLQAKTSADMQKDNSRGIELSLTDSVDTNLTGIERTTTKVLASVYFIEKVYTLVNPDLPELNIMESLQSLDSINKDIRIAATNGEDTAAIITSDATVAAYNKAKEVLTTIQNLALAICKTGILDTCATKAQKNGREYMDAQLFWTGMQKNIKDNCKYTNSFTPYMRKNKDKNAIVHVLSEIVDAYNMANSVVDTMDKIIANTPLPKLSNKYQRESYSGTINSTNLMYCPAILSVNGVGNEKMVLLQNPYTQKKQSSDNDGLDCDAVPLSLIMTLFPSIADNMKLDTNNDIAIQHFLNEVNTTIKINEELHNAQFRLNISSKKECEKLVNDIFDIPAFDSGNPDNRILTAGYFDANNCPMALDPVGNPDEKRLAFCDFNSSKPKISPVFEFLDTFNNAQAKNVLAYLQEHPAKRLPSMPFKQDALTTLKL
jgi:hypothetical protein